MRPQVLDWGLEGKCWPHHRDLEHAIFSKLLTLHRLLYNLVLAKQRRFQEDSDILHRHFQKHGLKSSEWTVVPQWAIIVATFFRMPATLDFKSPAFNVYENYNPKLLSVKVYSSKTFRVFYYYFSHRETTLSCMVCYSHSYQYNHAKHQFSFLPENSVIGQSTLRDMSIQTKISTEDVGTKLRCQFYYIIPVYLIKLSTKRHPRTIVFSFKINELYLSIKYVFLLDLT